MIGGVRMTSKQIKDKVNKDGFVNIIHNKESFQNWMIFKKFYDSLSEINKKYFPTIGKINKSKKQFYIKFYDDYMNLDEFSNTNSINRDIFNSIKETLFKIIHLVHTNHILHNDLHSQNIIINPKTLHCILIDWEFCNQINYEDYKAIKNSDFLIVGENSYKIIEELLKTIKTVISLTDLKTKSKNLFKQELLDWRLNIMNTFKKNNNKLSNEQAQILWGSSSRLFNSQFIYKSYKFNINNTNDIINNERKYFDKIMND
jgi:serine/threonine protein kinase